MSTVERKAVAAGKLNLGGVELDCYVLDDERCMVSQRSVVNLLTSDEQGRGGAKHGKLDRYLERLPHPEALEGVGPNVVFQALGGVEVVGRDALTILRICRSYKTAWRAGLLRKDQVHLAMKADILLDAVGDIGMVALIHEATGYQKVRASNALEQLLNRMVLEQAGSWERLWERTVAQSLGRLYRVPTEGIQGFPLGLISPVKRIYQMLVGEEVMLEIRERNGSGDARIARHHQYFSEELRHRAKTDLQVVQILADQSGSVGEFWARMEAHFLRRPLQLHLVGAA
jgi:hypothetical protein